jgi:hypothetical protein
MIVYEVNAYVKEKKEVKAVSLPTLLYIIGLYAGKGGREKRIYFASIVLYPGLVTSKIISFARSPFPAV